MKFINFLIVKFSLFLTAGILVAHFLLAPSFHYFQALAVIVITLIITWFFSRKQLFQNSFFGVITFVSFFLLGIVSYQIHLPELKTNHFTKIITPNSERGLFQLKITSILKTDLYNSKYLAKIVAINYEKRSGDILLNIKKDSLVSLLTIDDVILISSKLYPINKPLNPYQFDYAKYMKNLGVEHQLRISNKDVLQKTKGAITLRGKAENTRNYIIKKLRKSPITPDEFAIIQALILGQRKDISKEIYNDYAAAGAIHILAVSGLHVGIVFFILSFLFSPLKRVKNGKAVISILMVISLWGFAFITGLSPSVVRAVTMFSFFAFATIINRETNSINTLFLSYFLLLVINPTWLFHVGFQLSYLAVFFILWILPIFNKFYYPTNYFIKKVWGVFTVTIAAQIGIIPLSLYYFHQFPGLFFLTNIIILPFLGVLLAGGILIIILAVFNILPDGLAFAYNTIIKGMNGFINWIAHQEFFLVQDIHFSLEKVIVSYLLIITFILFWKTKKQKYVPICLFCFALLIGVFIFDNYKNSGNQFIVFHKSRKTLLGYKHGNDFTLFQSDTLMNFKNSYPIKGYRVTTNNVKYIEQKLPQVISYNKKFLLIIDSLGVYPKNKSIEIMLLTSSPKVNLERLIDSLQPKIILADGNNYTSYVKRWQKTCAEKKLPFHFTGKEGAFVIKQQD